MNDLITLMVILEMAMAVSSAFCKCRDADELLFNDHVA